MALKGERIIDEQTEEEYDASTRGVPANYDMVVCLQVQLGNKVGRPILFLNSPIHACRATADCGMVCLRMQSGDRIQ